MHAVVLGVNGVTGRAIALELVANGFEVVGTGRSAERFPAVLREAGIRFTASDRTDPTDLRAAVGGGADIVVDCAAYTAEHARLLLDHAGSIGSIVALSSKAVYVDASGRHANSDDPPDFGGPVAESTALMEPDFSGDYRSRLGYGANKVAMELTFQEAAIPVSILRPSRVHGSGNSRPREWWIVRRLLDGMRSFALARGGRTGNHPTAAANLARLVLACAREPAHRVLNSADPDMPTAADIVRAVAKIMSVELEISDLGAAIDDSGWSPWDTWPPTFLDMTAAQTIGYRPVGDYATTVEPAVRELMTLTPAQREQLDNDPYFAGR